jgi:2-polyprenyl-6-methoxyphenol hydroxylase-like FAD-dependent oxidoreductase
MKAVVIGAGPVGLASAMLLARDGWDVRVLEKDPAEPPETAAEMWSAWERPGVAQFRQPHIMMPRFRHVLDAELPEVREWMETLGARRFSLTEVLPQTLADRSPRPGDERFETLTARRPIIEGAFAHAALRSPGVDVRRGVGVSGLLASGSAPGSTAPHVVGVLLSSGEAVHADLVIDAMGRRSKLPEWIVALGGRPAHEEADDAGFAYYARQFRSRDGSVPDYRGPLGGLFGTFHALTQIGDNNCWTVGLAPMAGDAPLKALRHADVWNRVALSIPHVAHWLDGEPISDVLAMAGVLDRYRRFVIDGEPVATGVVAVGDAWACTNPTAGRGFSLGMMHAVLLRDVLREGAGDPHRLALRFDELTEGTLTPWYRDQVDRDRQRAAGIRATLDGVTPTPPDDPMRQMQAAFMAASAYDPDVARAFLEGMACLALPQQLMGRPGLADKVIAFAGSSIPQPPGPTRSELLQLLAA